jgi:hypothetical protein
MRTGGWSTVCTGMSVKRCPMCHQINERAWKCERCGYKFGQDPKVTLELLRSQRSSQRITFWVLISLTLLSIPLMLALLAIGFPPIGPPLGLLLLVVVTVRTWQKLGITASSIRFLERKQRWQPTEPQEQRELPEARVVASD